MSDINVTIVATTNASTSILNSDVISVTAGGGFSAGGATALLVEAGANITVTTAQGSFMIVGRDVPVQSINGKTGTVVLTSASVSAASAVHSHVAANVTDLTAVANVVSVNGRTGAVVLTSASVSAASAVHSHVAADVTDLTAVANVVSVNGRTGVVVLALTDFTAASAVHSHVAADVTDLTAVANVVSVNGKTGAVSLIATDVSAASAVHSHVAASVTDLTAVANVVSVNGITGTPSIVAGSNVSITTSGSSIIISSSGGGTTGGSVTSVNGKVGTVVLTSVDVSAASAVHSHVAANVTDLTAVANVVSVNGKTGTVSLVATDVTAAAASHGHSYVTSLNGNTGGLSIVAGSNITVSTSGTSIIVAGAAGAPGPPGSFADAQTISQKTASYTLELADVGTLLAFNGASTSSPISVSVPASGSVAWVQGSHIDVARLGTAAVSVITTSGVTVTATPGPALRDKGSAGTLVYLGSDQWLLVGDLDVAS